MNEIKHNDRLDWTITHKSYWYAVHNATGIDIVARTNSVLMSKINRVRKELVTN